MMCLSPPTPQMVHTPFPAPQKVSVCPRPREAGACLCCRRRGKCLGASVCPANTLPPLWERLWSRQSTLSHWTPLYLVMFICLQSQDNATESLESFRTTLGSDRAAVGAALQSLKEDFSPANITQRVFELLHRANRRLGRHNYSRVNETKGSSRLFCVDRLAHEGGSTKDG